MTFNSRKGRLYNPRKNPPVLPQNEPKSETDAKASPFELSDYSDATKAAMKEIIEAKLAEAE